MFVEPSDYRPLSSLTPRPPSVFELVGGVGTAIAVYAFFGLLATVLTMATGRSILDARAIGEEPPVVEPEEPEVVEAGFVQLGREWDPRELPDRRISSNFQEARAQDPNVVSPFQRLLDPDAGPRPPNTALNELLSDRTYTEEGNAAFPFEQEGVAHGAETPREGDTVLGQIHQMIRRGLQVPPNLPESEYPNTRARVCTTVDATWVLSSIRFAGSSGNDDWDRAVRNRVDEIAASHPSITPQDGQTLPRQDCINVVPVAGRRRRPAGSSPGGALGNLLGD